MQPDCIFCRIVAGEIPADVVHRGDGVLAFRDIAPKADVHVLVIPEQHVESLHEVERLDADAAKSMLDAVAATARSLGLADYRVISNAGAGAGQTVFHLHWHVMSGNLPPFA